MRRNPMTITIRFENTGGRQVKRITCPTENCHEQLVVAVDLERDTVPGASHCAVCRSDFFLEQHPRRSDNIALYGEGTRV